jgi:two-component system, LytTR family, response regulator
MSLPLKVVIIEDEAPAAEKLERYLLKYNPEMKILTRLDSVSSSVTWLEDHQTEADLIFMDVQLTDGKSFEIFKQVKVVKPVIFITAYNEYALDAFKVSSIDYLLKPVTLADLTASLQKMESLSTQLRWSDSKSSQVVEALAGKDRNIKTRFMVKLGDHIRSVTTNQISLFFADGRDVYLITDQQKKFIIDYTLENLEEVLDTKQFYRLNRSYIININAIQDVVVYSNSRLKISPNIKWEQEIIVSREKVSEFKEWFDGGH